MIDIERNRNARWIKDAILIRKATSVMNRDKGDIYILSHIYVWDGLFAKTTGEHWEN